MYHHLSRSSVLLTFSWLPDTKKNMHPAMWLKNTTCNVNDIKRKVAGEKFKMSFGGGAASRKKVYRGERCGAREQRKTKVYMYQT